MPHIELPQAEFKLVLLGDTHTGKTSLVLRFVEGHYKENRNSTVGAFFLTKRLTLESMTCKLLIWDTAGQEQFQKLAVTYYKQAAAAIVCYDVSGSIDEQISRLQGWLEQVQQNVASQSENRIVLLVAACKGDLPATPGIEDEAKQVAERYGAQYMKTSAKNDTNVSAVFIRAAETVLQCQYEAATGRGRPISVTMGGMSRRSFSPTNHVSSPAGVSLRGNNANGNGLSPKSQHHQLEANGGQQNNDSSTAGDSDDHLEQDGIPVTPKNAPLIMCDNGMLVCGEGSSHECVIL